VITGAILKLVSSMVAWFVTLMPNVPPMTSVTGSGDGGFSSLVGFMAGAASWLPFPVLFSCVVFVFSVLAVAGAVKGVRIVASFLTLGGGSAA
jgi:hypothetical protein